MRRRERRRPQLQGWAALKPVPIDGALAATWLNATRSLLEAHQTRTRTTRTRTSISALPSTISGERGRAARIRRVICWTGPLNDPLTWRSVITGEVPARNASPPRSRHPDRLPAPAPRLDRALPLGRLDEAEEAFPQHHRGRADYVIAWYHWASSTSAKSRWNGHRCFRRWSAIETPRRAHLGSTGKGMLRLRHDLAGAALELDPSDAAAAALQGCNGKRQSRRDVVAAAAPERRRSGVGEHLNCNRSRNVPVTR
jgi:hypothetical protein